MNLEKQQQHYIKCSHSNPLASNGPNSQRKHEESQHVFTKTKLTHQITAAVYFCMHGFPKMAEMSINERF